MLRATATSRTQHVVLRRLADELVALLDPASPLDELAVHGALDRVDSALKQHSELEVEGMYPQLSRIPMTRSARSRRR